MSKSGFSQAKLTGQTVVLGLELTLNPVLEVGSRRVGDKHVADPSAVYSNFRRVILGVDTRNGGAGPLRGFPTWNLDLAVMKDVRIREGIGATLSFQFVNVLNHFQPANPGLSVDNPGNFGMITGQANAPRQMEFGRRLFFEPNFVVRMRGLEPPLPCENQILSLARLPVSPHPRGSRPNNL